MKKRIQITTTDELEARCKKFLDKTGNEFLNRSILDNIAVDYYIHAMNKKKKIGE